MLGTLLISAFGYVAATVLLSLTVLWAWSYTEAQK